MTPVTEIVKDAITALGSTIRDQRLDVIVPDSLPDVDVDTVLIGQALVNLLDNAVRHSPPHGVITVRVERRDEQVVISVSDQGPGVPPADRETIFDRFAQLSTGGRAGLGLTIAKTFVEADGERVWTKRPPTAAPDS